MFIGIVVERVDRLGKRGHLVAVFTQLCSTNSSKSSTSFWLSSTSRLAISDGASGVMHQAGPPNCHVPWSLCLPRSSWSRSTFLPCRVLACVGELSWRPHPGGGSLRAQPRHQTTAMPLDAVLSFQVCCCRRKIGSSRWTLKTALVRLASLVQSGSRGP